MFHPPFTYFNFILYRYHHTHIIRSPNYPYVHQYSGIFISSGSFQWHD